MKENKSILILLIILLFIMGCANTNTLPIKIQVTNSGTDLFTSTTKGSINTQTPVSQNTFISMPTIVSDPGPVEETLPFTNTNLLEPGIYPVLSSSSTKGWFAEVLSKEVPQSYVDISEFSGLISPDGHSMIYMDNTYLWDFNFFTGDKQKIPQPEGGSMDGKWVGDWSPDGKYLVFAINAIHKSSDGTVTLDKWPNLYISDLEDNRFIQITDWPTIETSPIWSPDGNWIAFLADHAKMNIADFEALNSSDIYLFDTSCLHQIDTCRLDSSKQLTDTGVSGDISSPAWSPDSKRIAFIYTISSGSDEIFSVNLQGEMTNLLKTETQDNKKDGLSWSPLGNAIAFRSNTDTGEALLLYSLSDQSMETIAYIPDEDVSLPKWSPDGKYIAYTENSSSTEDDLVKVYSVVQNKSFPITSGNQYGYNFEAWISILPTFQTGAVLKVSPLGNNLSLHEQPSLSSTILSSLPNGKELTLIDGPEKANGYSWWKVKTDDFSGWVVQVPLWYLPDNPLIINSQ